MDSLPIQNPQGASPAQQSGKLDSQSSQPKTNAGGVSFQVLLEKLEQRALDLKAQSQSVEAPEHLADAVGQAREAFQDAASLTDQLVEAFRAAQQTPEAKPTSEDS